MKNILLILLLFILFSCKSTGDKTDCEVLHVDLVERPVPTEELFSKISVIPLETNDTSFLVRPVKVIIKDNRYYICLLYTSPSPRDRQKSRMPSSA